MTEASFERVRSRVDKSGFAFKGSMLQMQRFVNDESLRDVLELEVRSAHRDLGNRELVWRSPLVSDGYREYRDGAFLDAVERLDLIKELARFWPAGGPRWDGLAVVRGDGGDGVLPMEAKSHPGELRNEAARCRAEGTSLARIREAFAWTQGRIGAELEIEPWLGSLYQTANRLAHLVWLRDRLDGNAWLVHLFIVDDPTQPALAVGRAEWERAALDVWRKLALPAAIDGYEHIFVSGVSHG